MGSLLLIGGHGKVALLATPLLVQDGYAVDSVIRNPDHADDVAQVGGTPVVADVESMDTAQLTELISGHDAVVWSAGAGGGDPDRTYAVDRDAAMRAVDAAQAAGVRRFVMVSYFGARPDHGVPESEPFWHYAEAKAAADEHLRASDLDWTVLGPSTLTQDPGTGLIELDGASGQVARADVAAVIVETLRQPGTVGRTIRFNNGEVAVAEALP